MNLTGGEVTVGRVAKSTDHTLLGRGKTSFTDLSEAGAGRRQNILLGGWSGDGLILYNPATLLLVQAQSFIIASTIIPSSFKQNICGRGDIMFEAGRAEFLARCEWKPSSEPDLLGYIEAWWAADEGISFSNNPFSKNMVEHELPIQMGTSC